MKRMFVPTLLVALSLLVAACGATATAVPTTAPEPTAMPEPTQAPSMASIVDLAVADGRFTTLVGALQATGLVDALQGEGPFTVFAPTDDAFAALPAGTLEGLSTEQLTDILLYHVVSGKVMAADAIALDGQSVDTLLNGKQISITVEDGMVKINDATVVIADIEASNGVIHVINAVLLPPAG